jgi:single-stranded-DNA-specific exonuclease
VLNPNRQDDLAGQGHLAAAGVVFLFLVATTRALRREGFYRSRPEPDLLGLLDLVALGTVCDVVPLTGLNRAFVAQGIRVARRGANPGLKALAAVAGTAGPIDAYHLGFVLGPRVNAGGRVGAADLGARLLATDDPGLAAELAARLDGYNRERRQIEAETLAAAIAAVEAAPQSPALVFAAAEGWHPGVIGIVAARLRERYERPACVVALEGGIGRGSGRSVPGVALGPAVIAARQAGLLVNGGGHAMAAGFTVAEERLAELRDFLAERLGDGRPEAPLGPELAIDAALSAEGAGAGLIGHIEALAPYGAANPEPRFAFPGLLIQHLEPVGTGHLRATLADPLGPARLKAIAFRAGDSPLGAFLAAARGRAIHLAGHLRRDTWRGGEAVQLILADAAPAA